MVVLISVYFYLFSIKPRENMNFLEEQGKLLKEFRFKNGISLQKLSDKTGVAKSTLIALEAGKSKPQATTIFKLREYISKFE